MIGDVKSGCGVTNLGYGVNNCIAQPPAARIAGSILGREAWYYSSLNCSDENNGEILSTIIHSSEELRQYTKIKMRALIGKKISGRQSLYKQTLH